MGVDWTQVEPDIVRPRRHRTGVRVVVALLALAVAAASVLEAQFFTGRPSRARSDTPPKASSHAGSGGGANGRPVTAPATTTSTPRAPTTTTSPHATTTTTDPLRVLEIGDSLGEDLGDAMESTWPSATVHLTVAARGDTGLANSAYYDWPTALAALLSSLHPQVVVVLLGANDLQSMVRGSTILYDGTPAWNAEYTARVTEIVSESVRAGARVLWIGEPAMLTAFINAGMTRLDGIAQRVVAHFPGKAAYLSANSVLAPGGSFSFDVKGPTGEELQVRTPDGVHLMPAGADLLAAAAAKALATTWDMRVAGQ